MTTYDAHGESFAVLLLPGWRSRTGKLHIRRECRAVQFHAQHMTPVLIRMDDDYEVGRVLIDGELCGYCFKGWPGLSDETKDG